MSPLRPLLILLLSTSAVGCGRDAANPTISTSTRQHVMQTAARVAATRHVREPLFDPAISGNALGAYGALLDLTKKLEQDDVALEREYIQPAAWRRAPAEIRELAGSLRVRIAADAAVRGSRHSFISDPARFEVGLARVRARVLLSMAANEAFERGDTARAIGYALTSLRLGDDLSRVRLSFQALVHRELDVDVLTQLEAFATARNLTQRDLEHAIGGLQRIIDTQPELIDMLRHEVVQMNVGFVEDADDGRSPRDDVGDLNQRVYDDFGIDGLVDGFDDLLLRWERDLARMDDPAQAIHVNCSRELVTRTCRHLAELPAELAASKRYHEATYLTLARQLARRSPTAVAAMLGADSGQQTK